MNCSIHSRDGRCYLKDQTQLRGSLITKRRSIFRFKVTKDVGSLYFVGCKEYKQSLVSSFSFLSWIPTVRTARSFRVVHPRIFPTCWVFPVFSCLKPSCPALFHSFPRKGTNSGPRASVGQTGLATFSYSRIFWFF